MNNDITFTPVGPKPEIKYKKGEYIYFLEDTITYYAKIDEPYYINGTVYYLVERISMHNGYIYKASHTIKEEQIISTDD